VDFESVIKRVFEVVTEAVIFICYWGVKYALIMGISEDWRT